MSVGITEGYDPSYDLRWRESKCDMNIIITKRLTDEVIDGLLDMKANTILHLGCTGLHKLEPNAFTVVEQVQAANRLVSRGFPREQIVLRVDPIIPTEKGAQTAKNVIEYFCTNCDAFSNKTRVRFSFLDMYKHVIDRFDKAAMPLPYTTFNAPTNDVVACMTYLISTATQFGFTLETCAEGSYGKNIPNEFKIGCVSERDAELLSLDPAKVFVGQNYQRKLCLCCSAKVELIPVKKQCPNNCLYCYWRN